MDNQSLVIVLGLVSLVTALAMLANWASNKQIPGLLTISIGYTITCVGIVLISQQGTLPPFVSLFVAITLIMGGCIPVLSGLANFWNQETTKLPLVCSVLFFFTVIAIYYFSFVEESMLLSTRLYTIMMSVFSVCTAFILLRGIKIERKLRPVMAINTNFGAYLLITLAIFSAIFEPTLLFFSDEQAANSFEQSIALMLLGSIVNMVIFTVGILIMTMEELKIEYQEDAIFDPISTILNNRTFIEVSNRVLGVALRYSKPVSMLSIEVTNLEDIAKTNGPKVGNAMLRHFALMATNRRRNEDVLARTSHNQFRMLLPGVDESGAEIVIAKIQTAVAGEEYVYEGTVLKPEFLISSVTKHSEDLQLQKMLQEGDVELFKLKHPHASPV